MEHHPHTQYFLQTHFGIDSVPTWWRRRKDFVEDLAGLWNKRQECFYQGTDKDAYRALQHAISKRYKVSYVVITHLLGVAATDPSSPYGVMRDYLLQGEPRLIRTKQ